MAGFHQPVDEPFRRILADFVPDRAENVVQDAAAGDLDLPDSHIAAAAAFAFDDVSFFQREARADHIVDLRGNALELLGEFVAPAFRRSAWAAVQYVFPMLVDEARNVAHPSSSPRASNCGFL